jgi:hypothetical protein
VLVNFNCRANNFSRQFFMFKHCCFLRVGFS